MNKSDNSKSVTIHRRVKSSTSVDRSQVKRPVAKQPAKTTPAKSSDSSVAVTIKKTTPARSKMISHFNSKMSSDNAIGVKIIKNDSVKSNQKTAPVRTIRVQSATPKSTKTTTTKAASSEQVVMHPMLRAARARMQERRMMMVSPQAQSYTNAAQSTQSALTARELKDIAIKKALASTTRTTEKEVVKPHKLHFSFGRIMIALGCTAAAIFAIAYFINLNISDFSLYAAAKQAGIESANKEPHVPSEYSITNISSENGKIEINYKHSETGEVMTITEEKSSWDSNALLTNYVRSNYLNAFATIREQGLTIYISESNACWVNGGIVYKITAPAGSLDKKQIRQIATSL